MLTEIKKGSNKTGFLHHNSAVVKHVVEFVIDSKREIRILNIWQKHRNDKKMNEIDFIGYDWNQINDITEYRERYRNEHFLKGYYKGLIKSNLIERIKTKWQFTR